MNSQFENGLNNLAEHAAHGEVGLNADDIRGAVRRRQNTRRAGQIAGGTLAVAALAFGAVQVSGSFRDELPAAPLPSPTTPAPETIETNYPQLPTPAVDPYWGEAPDYILDPSLYPDAVVAGLLTKEQVDEFFGDFTASANLGADPLGSTGDWDYRVADITDDWLLLTYAYIEPPEDNNFTQQLVEGDPRVVSVNRQTGETHVLAEFGPVGEDAAHSFHVGHITAAISGDNALWFDPSTYSAWGSPLNASAQAVQVAAGQSHPPVIDRCVVPQEMHLFLNVGDEDSGANTVTGITIGDDLVAVPNQSADQDDLTVALCSADGAIVTSPQLRYDQDGELVRPDGSRAEWSDVSFRAVLQAGEEQIALHTMKVPDSNGFMEFGALTPQWFAVEASASEGVDVRFVVDRTTGLLYTATGSDWRSPELPAPPVVPPDGPVVPATTQAPQTTTIPLAELPGLDPNNQLLYLAQTPDGEWTEANTPIVVSAWTGTDHRQAMTWALDHETYEMLWQADGVGQCFYLEGGTQLLCSAPKHLDQNSDIVWDYSVIYLIDTLTGESQEVATVDFMLESVTPVAGEYILTGSSRGSDGTRDYARMGAARGTLTNPTARWTALTESFEAPELPERWATHSVNSTVVWVGDSYYFGLFDADTGVQMPHQLPTDVQALANGNYVITAGGPTNWRTEVYDSDHNLVHTSNNTAQTDWEVRSDEQQIYGTNDSWFNSSGQILGKLTGSPYGDYDGTSPLYNVTATDHGFYTKSLETDNHLVNRHSTSDGRLLWSHDIGARPWLILADSADEALLITTEEEVIAFDVTTGDQLWQHPLHQPDFSLGMVHSQWVGSSLAVVAERTNLEVLSFDARQ